MQIKSYAKINISLDIIGRREDGYHLLEMIMQQVELYDLIDVNIIAKGIKISCNKSYVPTDERNIAYKAAKLFMDTYKINKGVSINIEKNIPVAAGLAGGSGNGATVLRGMRDLFEVNASDEDLMKLGAAIGADVPYCIKGGTALCEGIGEKLTPIKSFKDKIILLVKPNFGVSTKETYKAIDINRIHRHPKTNELIKNIECDNLKFVAANMRNVLENVTLKKYPIIISIKETMMDFGALGSMMSGSGPTVFGIYDDMLSAQRAFEYFREKYSEVYITRTI